MSIFFGKYFIEIKTHVADHFAPPCIIISDRVKMSSILIEIFKINNLNCMKIQYFLNQLRNSANSIYSFTFGTVDKIKTKQN